MTEREALLVREGINREVAMLERSKGDDEYEIGVRKDAISEGE